MPIAARVPILLRAGLFLVVAASSASFSSCRDKAPSVLAAELRSISLPQPQITGGMPLMQALAQRRTTREFRDQPLGLQALSNLLWAAFGVNRARDAKPGLGRTAPSAMNSQDIEIDVVLADGVYVYEAEANRLRAVAAEDVRSRVCQGQGAQAAVTLVFVAPANDDWAQVDVGFIGQNVYLFAASEGLNAWFYSLHGQQDPATVAAALKLPADKRPLYAESVGFPKN